MPEYQVVAMSDERSFEVGKERRILFTHDSFHGAESFPLPGPVYIHADRCGGGISERSQRFPLGELPGDPRKIG